MITHRKPLLRIKSQPYQKGLFQNIIWVLFLLVFSLGFFVGGAIQGFASKYEIDKTKHSLGNEK